MNLEKFRQAQFERRTATVPVPALSSIFDDGQKPELTVQGLTGFEIAKANDRVRQNAAINEIAEKVVSKKLSTVAHGIAQALGIGDDVPEKHVFHIAVFEFGVVSDEFKQEDVVKFADVYPVEFSLCVSKVMELTGLGQVHQGESNASGTTPASEAP